MPKTPVAFKFPQPPKVPKFPNDYKPWRQNQCATLNITLTLGSVFLSGGVTPEQDCDMTITYAGHWPLSITPPHITYDVTCTVSPPASYNYTFGSSTTFRVPDMDQIITVTAQVVGWRTNPGDLLPGPIASVQLLIPPYP